MSAWTERADRTISAQLAGYRHDFASALRARSRGIEETRCPRCGQVLTPLLGEQHCPRCLARRVAVELHRFTPGGGR